MGLAWSFGVVFAIVIAGVLAVLISWWMIASDDSEGFSEGLGAIFVAIILGVFIFVVAVVVGSAAIAAYFARRFRLRSDDLSRTRALVIGLIWFVGSFLTLALLIALMTGADALLNSS
jgi:hypothetical protein